MSQKQLEHIEVKNIKLKSSIYVLCDNISSPENLGMIFRIAEAFGAKKLIISELSPTTDSSRLKRAARNADQLIEYKYSDNLKSDLIELKNKGFHLVGLEITNKSKPIDEAIISENKIAILVGSERNGISQELLNIIDETFHIPMFGKNSSMNVANALSIALYEITKQLSKLG